MSWPAASRHPDPPRLFDTFAALWAEYGDARLILVDIPIGLPRSEIRDCDRLARMILGRPRGSSVFSPPSRAALQYASERYNDLGERYRRASHANQEACGRKLSWQSFGILPKIAEVDSFLRRAPAAKRRVRECHPELCFHALSAGGRGLKHAKKTQLGQKERLRILQRHLPAARAYVSETVAAFGRKSLAADDVIDALVAAVTAREPHETVPPRPECDAYGLPMQMVVYRPTGWVPYWA